MNQPSINDLWAKSEPLISLPDHLLETGKCAQALLKYGVLKSVKQKIKIMLGLTEEEVYAFMGYLAAIHDIGKCHPQFQAKNMRAPGINTLKSAGMISESIERSARDKCQVFRHEQYTGIILRDLLKKHNICSGDPLWKAIVEAIVMHHQGKGTGTESALGKNPSPEKLISRSCKPEKWIELTINLDKLLLDEFKPPLNKAKLQGCADAVIYLIMGIVILSDWVASDDAMCNHMLKENESNIIDYVLKTRDLLLDDSEMPHANFHNMWPNIPVDELRGIQTAAEILGENPAKMYIIEAPMGEGKSEAALYLAERQRIKFGCNGFYMALPTSATGNQMFKRVNSLFEMHNMPKGRLLHGTAWMIDESTPNKAVGADENENENISQQWLAPLRRGLLSRFAVGTVDQAMLSVMRVKYGVLRLLGLAGKVLIIDEVHAYDTYMQTIIERLLTWCKALDIPVILLSATLPISKKESLIKSYGAVLPSQLTDAYPMITTIENSGAIKEIPVSKVHMRHMYSMSIAPFMEDAEQTAILAYDMVKDGGCICVLVNTVAKAQKVYTYLKEVANDVNLNLFHARFPVCKKQEIETRCVALYGKDTSHRPSKSILVATQVMEQSIDVDFDAMITDIAPIDLILQRMGRVHRFVHTPRPSHLQKPLIHILTNRNGYNGTKIYPGLLLQKTEKFLNSIQEIKTPDMIRECIESVYGNETPKEKEMYEMWAKAIFTAQQDSAQAEGSLLEEPEYDRPKFADITPTLWQNDDELSNYTAKTRIGDGSSPIVLLTSDELNQLHNQLSQWPDKETAKRLLMQSVPIITKRLGDEPDTIVRFKGLLKGTIFLPTVAGKARWGNYSIYNDDELGVIIERIN